jgi:hypothetical protein
MEERKNSIKEGETDEDKEKGKEKKVENGV